MFAQEIRHARLLLTRSPIMSIAAILALAIGIAGNSAIFSIVSGLMLKPLPYPHPERLVIIMTRLRSNPGFNGSVSVPDFLDWRARSKTLDHWALFVPMEGSALIDGVHLTLRDVYVTSGFVQASETEPLLGALDPAGAPEDSSRIYISERLWRDHLHADPQIIGKTMVVEGKPRSICAVLPAAFDVGSQNGNTALWIPMPIPKEQGRADHEFLALARLRPGFSLSDAKREMSRISDDLSRQYPVSNNDFTSSLSTLQSFITLLVSAPLWTLFAAVLMVQLIVCINVASLLLSRGAERAQQTAIRLALGASLSDVARQCLAEGLTLALAGCVLGLGLGRALLALVLQLQARIPRAAAIRFDWRVALFTVLLSVATGILASLVPWWQARFIDSGHLLREGTRATASAQRRRVLRIFAGAEIALSLMLLMAAGLLVANLSTAQHVDLGYDPDRLFAIRIIVPSDRHATDAELSAFYDGLLKRATSPPGLEHVSLISLLPPDWGNNGWFFVNGQRDPTTAKEFIEKRVISLDYFDLMQVPMIKGRPVAREDLKSREKPIVINQTAEKMYWHGRNALGGMVTYGDTDTVPMRVVGVSRDYRNAGPRYATRPEVYMPYQVAPERHMYLTARSNLAPERVYQLLRNAVVAGDPAVSVSDLSTMKQMVVNSVLILRFQAVLLTALSFFSVLLAIVGVYSVMSYSVSQRTLEIGVRLALGADPFRTLKMIVRDGFRLAAIAASSGMLIAIAIAVSAPVHTALQITLKPLPLVAAYLLILVAAAAASFLPARRAALVDPMVALRPETPWSLKTSLRALGRAPRLLRFYRDRKSAPAAFDPQWLTRVAESMNQAQSVNEVLTDGLARLRQSVGAECAVLLVASTADTLSCAASDRLPDPTRVHALRTDAFVVRRLRRMLHPLIFDPQDLAAWEHFAAQSDPETRAARMEEIATLRAMHSVLLVPVWLKGQMLALISFGPRGAGYDPDDFLALEVAATQLAFVIENGRLLDRVAAEEKTRQELALAARVQRRLFPDKPLHIAQIELAGECQPARTIGGDYYDFLELPDGQIGIALADVAGKGIAAALLTSVIQASVRSLAPDQGRPLPELVKRINQLLYQTTESNSYATFFYAQFDPVRRRLSFVNAGHNPPYFLRIEAAPESVAEGGRTRTAVAVSAPVLRELTAGGPIIGLLPVVAYEEQHIDLQQDDLLVAYTDGVPEALNANEDEYGEDRLRDLVLRLHDRPADQIRRAVLDDVRGFIGLAAQYDDMTVLVLKVK